MAHVIVEWSDNLEGKVDIKGLLHLVAEQLRAADGVFPWGGIRVRALRLDTYVIADGLGEDAFINLTVKMGAGRPEEFKKSFFSGMFAKISDYLAPVFEERYLALSMYIEEADEQRSFKRNTIHERFRKT